MIEYTNDKPAPGEIERLYRNAGWIEEHYTEFQQTVENTSHWILARQDGMLVGMGRIMTDGFLYACIYDVIVHTAHRNRGIGREILRLAVLYCDSNNIKKSHLWPAKGLIRYYKDFGFEPLSDEQPTMVRKQPSNR